MKKEINKNKKPITMNPMWIKIGIFALIFIIIVVVIIILFVTPAEKDNDKKTEATPQPTDPAEVKTPDYYTLINYLNLNTLPAEYYGYFFQSEKVTASKMANNIKIYMAIRKIVAENPTKYLNTDKKLEIEAKEVEDALVAIFGQKVKYEHASLNGNSCSYTNFKYDEEQKRYQQLPSDCDESARTTIYTELVNTEEDDDKITISQKVAFINFDYNLEEKKTYYYIYSDLGATDLIGTAENYGIDSCRDDVPVYQFTFLKDKETGSYYFDQVELVK